jgi:hypothetical protein
MANPTIIVATPVFGDVFYTPYVQSLLRLQQVARERQWAVHHMTVSYAHINESRNYLITNWYDKTEASHLLFVDADMGFAPQLVFDMVAFDKPVVGTIYTKRQVDLKRLAEFAAKLPAERAIAQAHDFIVRPVRGRPPRRDRGFIEVEGCGTGIMLIQRAAIAAMLKKLPAISDPTATNASPLGAGLDRMIRVFDNITVERRLLVNDFAFCHRWHKLCQGELWARADQAVTHIGLHKYGARYTDAGMGQPRVTLTGLAGALSAKRAGNGKSGGGEPKAAGGRLPMPEKSKPSGK